MELKHLHQQWFNCCSQYATIASVQSTDIVTASVEELEAQFNAAQELEILSSFAQDTNLVIYLDGVQPLNLEDLTFTNII